MSGYKTFSYFSDGHFCSKWKNSEERNRVSAQQLRGTIWNHRGLSVPTLPHPGAEQQGRDHQDSLLLLPTSRRDPIHLLLNPVSNPGPQQQDYQCYHGGEGGEPGGPGPYLPQALEGGGSGSTHMCLLGQGGHGLVRRWLCSC